MSEIRIVCCARKLHTSSALVSGNVGSYTLSLEPDALWQGYESYYLTFRRALGQTLKVTLEGGGDTLSAPVPAEMLEAAGCIEIGLCAVSGSRVLSSELLEMRVLAGADDAAAREWPRLQSVTAELTSGGGTLGYDEDEYDGMGEVILPKIENLAPENIRSGVDILDVSGTFDGEKYAVEGIYVEETHASGNPKAVYYGYGTMPAGVFGGIVGESPTSYFSGVSRLSAALTELSYGTLSNNTALDAVTLPKLTAVEANVFSGNSMLTSVTLGSPGSAVTSISAYAFAGASRLSQVAIYTEGGEKIDDEAWKSESMSVTYYSA